MGSVCVRVHSDSHQPSNISPIFLFPFFHFISPHAFSPGGFSLFLGEEWDLLAKMESMEGSKIKKLRAQMQLSQSQLQRITRSFTKYDLEKTGR